MRHRSVKSHTCPIIDISVEYAASEEAVFSWQKGLNIPYNMGLIIFVETSKNVLKEIKNFDLKNFSVKLVADQITHSSWQIWSFLRQNHITDYKSQSSFHNALRQEAFTGITFIMTAARLVAQIKAGFTEQNNLMSMCIPV